MAFESPCVSLPGHARVSGRSKLIQSLSVQEPAVGLKVRGSLPEVAGALAVFSSSRWICRRDPHRRRCRGLIASAQATDLAEKEDDFATSQKETEDLGSSEEPFETQELGDPDTERSKTEECLTEFGLSGKQLWKVQKFWSISGERVPPASRCIMVRDYLQNEVGLDSAQLARTIADCPEVLQVFSAETLKEKVRFLEVEVGVAEDDLAEIIATYPKVFCRPLLTTLRPALEFWLDQAKVNPEEFPKLLKQHALQIWSRPQSLEPKLRFATEVMGCSVEEIFACKTPFFRLSMSKIVAPRHFFTIERQKTGLGLDNIVSLGEVDFCSTLQVKVEEYQEWLKEWPYSEQARALSWLEPKKKSFGQRGSWNGQAKSNNDRRSNKKGRFSTGQRYRSQRRRPPRGDDRFLKAEDLEERFSQAEL